MWKLVVQNERWFWNRILFSVLEEWKYKDSQLLFWIPENLKFTVFVFIVYKLRGVGEANYMVM